MKKLVIPYKGGRAYRIYKTGNKYIVSVDKGGVFSYKWNKISETSSYEDALALIKVHSGSEIKKIRDL